MSGPFPRQTWAGTARAARDILEADLSSLPEIAAQLGDGALDRMEAYVELLLAANERLNLTRLTHPDEVARGHLLDALAALPQLGDVQPALAIDLGSGGGVPAFPLAIARPDLSWLLVESVGKKAQALAGFAEALALANVSVVAERAELIGRDPHYRERGGLVTARAVASLPVLAELALPLLAQGGLLLAWKGPLSPADEELQRGATAAALLGGARPQLIQAGPPQLGGHSFVRLTKQGTTPSRYARRPGEPAQRPLG